MPRMHEQNYRLLGRNVAYYRAKAQLTQEQLAERIGKSRTHVSNVESPKVGKCPSLDMLFDISEALNVPVSRLFEER